MVPLQHTTASVSPSGDNCQDLKILNKNARRFPARVFLPFRWTLPKRSHGDQGWARQLVKLDEVTLQGSGPGQIKLVGGDAIPFPCSAEPLW